MPNFPFIVGELVQVNLDNSLAECVNLKIHHHNSESDKMGTQSGSQTQEPGGGGGGGCSASEFKVIP